MQLSSKGFFTTIFHHLDDKSKVEEGGPYLFNDVSLYMRNWVERFNLDLENFAWTSVWVYLYSLPQDY